MWDMWTIPLYYAIKVPVRQRKKNTEDSSAKWAPKPARCAASAFEAKEPCRQHTGSPAGQYKRGSKDIKLVREPAGCLQKIASVNSASTYFALINTSQSYYTRTLSYSQAFAMMFYRSNFLLNRYESEEKKNFLHSVDLLYSSEVEITVEKNQHTLAPTIVHLLKTSRWIKRKFIFNESPPALVANQQTGGIKRSHWAHLEN
uniref:Uncharacterized protein n=1 Tax=Oryza punctata TaxID=4537 RepID=A0A0E0LLX5_ORYPU